MKFLSMTLLALTSFSALASPSIKIEMPAPNGSSDLYTIPSQGRESVEQSLIVMANLPSSNRACYVGTVQEVKQMLDRTVISATNVKSYSSSADYFYFNIKMIVYNKYIRKTQRVEYSLKPCSKL